MFVFCLLYFALIPFAREPLGCTDYRWHAKTLFFKFERVGQRESVLCFVSRIIPVLCRPMINCWFPVSGEMRSLLFAASGSVVDRQHLP